ncbi:hypothetical protein PROFUN_16564, partial [Planoprotostelium fungivorum]
MSINEGKPVLSSPKACQHGVSLSKYEYTWKMMCMGLNVIAATPSSARLYRIIKIQPVQQSRDLDHTQVDAQLYHRRLSFIVWSVFNLTYIFRSSVRIAPYFLRLRLERPQVLFRIPLSVRRPFEHFSRFRVRIVHRPLQWFTFRAIYKTPAIVFGVCLHFLTVTSDLVHHIPSANIMVFTYRKHPYTQGDIEEKSDVALSSGQLASAFSFQPDSVRIKRSDGVTADIIAAIDNTIYTVHGTPAAQAAPAGPLWGSTGLSGSSSHSGGPEDLSVYIPTIFYSHRGACCGPYVIAGLGGNLNTRVHIDRVLAPFTTVPTMIDEERMKRLLSSDLGSKFYWPDTLVKDYPSLFQSG